MTSATDSILPDGTTIAEKEPKSPEFVDATDAAAELTEALRPKEASWAFIIHGATKKRYIAVRPKGSMLEKIVAKTQKSLTVGGKKGTDPEQRFEYATRFREAWSVMACLHVVDPNKYGPGKPGPGTPLFSVEKRNDQNAAILVDQPYEVDGLLNDVGARLVKWCNDGTPFDASVEEAKAN